MDYARILRDTIALVWRHRFLWFFALLGGGSCTPLGAFNVDLGPRSSPSEPPPDLPPPLLPLYHAVQELPATLAAHQAEIVAFAALLALVGLVALGISFVCRGALIGSAVRLAYGDPASLGAGWRMGVRLGWRYARLWLFGLVIVALGLVAGAFVAAVIYVVFSTMPAIALLLGVVLGLAAIVAALGLALILSICFVYAERAVAVDDLGVLEAVRRGTGLLVAAKLDSLGLWLIGLALGIGVGAVLMIVALFLGLPLFAIVVAAFVGGGVSVTSVVIALLAMGAWGLILWGIGAIGSTAISVYWTLGYLAMTDRYPRIR